jgi:CheY-like chemotaxis protein
MGPGLTLLTSQVHVENGELAVQRWRAEPFDCILMDVNMPVRCGPCAIDIACITTRTCTCARAQVIMMGGHDAAAAIRAAELREGRNPVPIDISSPCLPAWTLPKSRSATGPA